MSGSCGSAHDRGDGGIDHGLKSNFAGAKSVKVKKSKTVSVKLKSLKEGKNYYVRVRAYSTVGKKTYYSKWSKARRIKVE